MIRFQRKMSTSIRWAVDFKAWLPSGSDISLAASCIQPEEKARIGQFVFRRDLKSSLIGRLLMRKFINDNSSLPYNKILIDRDSRGKPFCKDLINLKFNVSHHGRFSVLAGEINSKKDIGIDIMTAKYEGGKNLSEFFRLMSRQFSGYEWKFIQSGKTDREKMLNFNRNWALKESYVKATGTGIVIDLQSIEFHINTRDLCVDKYVTDTKLFIAGLMQPWRFEEILFDEEHVVAVALGGLEPHYVPANFQILTVSEVLKNALPLTEPDLEFRDSFLKKVEDPSEL